MNWKYWCVVLALLFLSACESAGMVEVEAARVGGGQDARTVHLPFAVGYTSRCVQGAGGSYSHNGANTRYDADFDTPNDRSDPVYSPAEGIARVHDDLSSGFGRHINIDLQDGTYIVLGHLSTILIADGAGVAEGTFLGYEGSTGNSSGDHVHIGRHQGDARRDAEDGTSVSGLSFSLDDVTAAAVDTVASTSDLVCSLTTGHIYRSRLPTPHFFPDGTLLKSPNSATVYLVSGDDLRPFQAEGYFLNSNYSFAEVVLVPDDVLDTCYHPGAYINVSERVQAVRGSGPESGNWLLVGSERRLLPAVGWQGVLKTWGVSAATLDELPYATSVGVSLSSFARGAPATYRTGALVRRASDGAVFAIVTDGAWAVQHERVLNALGFSERTVVEVEGEEFAAIASNAGDCRVGFRCLDMTVMSSCPLGNFLPPSDEPIQDSPSVVEEEGDEDVGMAVVEEPEPVFVPEPEPEEVPEPEALAPVAPPAPVAPVGTVLQVALQRSVGNWELWAFNASRWSGDWPGITNTECAHGVGTSAACAPTVSSGDILWINGSYAGGWLVWDGGDVLQAISINGLSYPIDRVRADLPQPGRCSYRPLGYNDVQCHVQ